jgi:hypothetical protein
VTQKQRQQGAFHAPLKPKDSETQTEGCRHTNPDICASNALPKVCAFVRNDGMCLKPPALWPKQFRVLSGSLSKVRTAPNLRISNSAPT